MSEALGVERVLLGHRDAYLVALGSYAYDWNGDDVDSLSFEEAKKTEGKKKESKSAEGKKSE